MPAAASASASSPPRPKTNGSPPFRRTTRQAAPRALEQQLGDDRLLDPLAAAVLADQDALRLRRRVVEQPRAGQVVVDHDVGARQAAHAVERDQPRRARPRADQIHDDAAPSAPAVGDVGWRSAHPGSPARAAARAPPCASSRSPSARPMRVAVGGGAGLLAAHDRACRRDARSSARSVRRPSAIVACAASGVTQLPPTAARKARSASIACRLGTVLDRARGARPPRPGRDSSASAP